MPCEECENGKYKWGETGECEYETLEDCQLANQGEYLEETIKPKYNHEEDVDYTMNFTQEQMEELHTNGEVIVHVEEEGKEMVIKFTYTPDEVDAEELEREYENLTDSLLDDELDEYIDKLADSIKKL
jgi:histidinol dehydrogenase|tara:strand:- start:30836 stop:31219 length:384 start_codon:yes stop_codon:yes gene_type:complete